MIMPMPSLKITARRIWWVDIHADLGRLPIPVDEAFGLRVGRARDGREGIIVKSLGEDVMVLVPPAELERRGKAIPLVDGPW